MGGRIDFGAEDHEETMLALGSSADPVACVGIAGMLPAHMFDRAREIISCADSVRLAISASLDLLADASEEHRATLVNDIGKLLRWVPDPGQRAGHLLETAELVREGPLAEALRDDVVRQLGLLAADDTRRVLGQAHLVLLEPPGRQRDAHLDDVLGQIDRLDPELRLETLLRLAGVAPEDPGTTERILTRAFAAARAVPRPQGELPYARDERRIRLMGVPGHRHRHADAWSVPVPDDYEQPWSLNSVLRKTPAVLLPLALEEIAKVPFESSRLGALDLIAEELPKDALPTALQVAWRPSSGVAAARTLATASASLPGSRDGGLCATALDLALAIPYNDLRSRTLYHIAGTVARRLPDRVVEASRAVPTEYFTAEILRAGAEHASADHLEDILRAAREIPDAHWFAGKRRANFDSHHLPSRSWRSRSLSAVEWCPGITQGSLAAG